MAGYDIAVQGSDHLRHLGGEVDAGHEVWPRWTAPASVDDGMAYPLARLLTLWRAAERELAALEEDNPARPGIASRLVGLREAHHHHFEQVLRRSRR